MQKTNEREKFSIHASAKEATLTTDSVYVMIPFSIHASAKEATIKAYRLVNNKLFQSTPPRRRRRVG